MILNIFVVIVFASAEVSAKVNGHKTALQFVERFGKCFFFASFAFHFLAAAMFFSVCFCFAHFVLSILKKFL